MLDDGIYGLSFVANPSDDGAEAGSFGEGLAVLRRGQIVGADRHGGLFQGSYRYDPENDGNTVEVRLTVPPHGVLLTGFAAGPDGASIDISARFDRPKPVSSATVSVAGASLSVQLRYVGPLGQ